MERQKIIKCCVYITGDVVNPEGLEHCSKDYIDFFHNRKKEENKYCDVGDDPSFYCADKYKSNITWGICRHDIRLQVDINDEIFFVACDKTDNRKWKYYLVGYGTVSKKISQKDIYEDLEWKIFQSYFNLLIKREGNRFVHHEVYPNEWWHNCDGIDKITKKKKVKWKKQISNCYRYAPIINFENLNFVEENFPFGKVYVVFSNLESVFKYKNPIPICEINRINPRKPLPVWKENYEQYFCYSKEQSKNFTSGNSQNPAFYLNIENSEKLKILINEWN